MAEPRRAGMVGLGYVGLVTAAGLASLDVQVSAYDANPARRAELQAGRVPFFEPGLPEVVAEGRKRGALKFVDDARSAIRGNRIVFAAVGTPPGPDGSADLSAVEAVAADLAAHADPSAVLAIKSTVPPGTGDRIEERLAEAGRADIRVVSAPEFLAEGSAVNDFFQPGRLVFGGEQEAARAVADLFSGLPPAVPRMVTSRRTSELAKYASNAFLAARVSLINEMANLCDAVGADVRDVARVVGADPRIGPSFLRPGVGYGGSCFPKDIQALLGTAGQHSVPMPVLAATHTTNEGQWLRVAQTAAGMVGRAGGAKIGLLGIAFKPGTDDVRNAPGPRLAAHLASAGAEVRCHDPVARLPSGLPAGVVEVRSPQEAADGGDLLILVTDWPDYRAVDPRSLSRIMRRPQLLDGRNFLDFAAFRAAGFSVRGVGTG